MAHCVHPLGEFGDVLGRGGERLEPISDELFVCRLSLGSVGEPFLERGQLFDHLHVAASELLGGLSRGLDDARRSALTAR